MYRTSSARRKVFPSTHCFSAPRLIVRQPIPVAPAPQNPYSGDPRRGPMQLFAHHFEDLLLFVSHCFDRVVIHGYLSGLSRPEQAVYFFRDVGGERVISKEVLSRRTQQYQAWVEAYARNHQITIQWAEKGVRKEDYLRPELRHMERKNQ